MNEKDMRILHFVLGRVSLHSSNGVNKVIHGLCKYSSRSGHEVRVLGISTSSKKPFHKVDRDGFQVEVFNGYTKDFKKHLRAVLENIDIVHLHSVWNRYNIYVANLCVKMNVPFVITVHSGFSEDRLRQSKYLIKLAYHKLFQKSIFEKAHGIHAITREETTAIAKMIDNQRVFCIPNGIDLEMPEIKNGSLPFEKPKNSELIVFGYLGRISIEKNIGSLFRAIKLLPKNIQTSIKCVIIGPNDNEEALELEELVKRLKIENIVEFAGPMYGEEKYRALSSFDFYIHPALSDVVSIAVKEAMMCGLPSIITRTSDVAYYYNTDSFVMVEPHARDIANGIVEMLDRKVDWTEMSQNAQSLVKEKFNWKAIVPKMLSEYKNIIDG